MSRLAPLADFVLGRPRSLWLRALRSVPAIVLMAGIFYVSSRSKPPGRELASAYLGPSLGGDVHVHLLVYAALAATMIWALWPNFRLARWSFVLGWFFCSAYGAIDEYHQSFVTGRTASVRDSLIDSAGALVACLVCGGLYVLFKRRRSVA